MLFVYLQLCRVRGITLTKSEVRSQPTLPSQEGKSEVVFETEIYAPSQKLFALKGGVLDPIIFDNHYPLKYPT
ncbi:MAG: hypothetical protein WBM32_21475, partial [Crocosphaera sp.]